MPKPYQRKMPATWWLQKRAYFWFMMRELTAVLMAIYCVALLVVLYRLKQRDGSIDEVMALLQTPWSVGLHFVAFVAAMYHTATWFALVPKALVVRMGEEKVPPFVLVGAHWLAFAVISALLVWFVFVLGPTL